MFVFNRSAAAVLVPLALLVAVVLWSGRASTSAPDAARAAPTSGATTVAQADEPHVKGS